MNKTKKINIYIVTVAMLLTIVGNLFIALAEDRDAYINSSYVRIRTGPSTSSKQFTINDEKQVFALEQKVKVTDKATDEKNETWYQVVFTINNTEYTGWVYGEYVTFLQSDSTTEETENKESNEQNTDDSQNQQNNESTDNTQETGTNDKTGETQEGGNKEETTDNKEQTSGGEKTSENTGDDNKQNQESGNQEGSTENTGDTTDDKKDDSSENTGDSTGDDKQSEQKDPDDKSQQEEGQQGDSTDDKKEDDPKQDEGKTDDPSGEGEKDPEGEKQEDPQPPTEEKREATVIQTLVRVREGPGTNYDHYKGLYYEYLQTVLIVGEDKDENGYKWYQVECDLAGEHIIKWIRSDFVQEKIDIKDDTDFDQYLTDQGFPEDYQAAIKELHAIYPEWKFVAYDTGLEWKEFIDMESRLGYSLIDGNDLALRSVAEGAYNVNTKSFIAYDGNNWYCANRDTVAYFADPRNFLNKVNIFMFLHLGYKEFETAEVVQKLLNGTFMEGEAPVDKKKYAEIFAEAGQKSMASPIYLATLAKQEQGTTGSAAIRGGSFSYNGKSYSGLYNFYNIGATSGADNWKKGLVYANGGENGSAKTWNRPWTSPSKSIIGGALWIADGYINVGQNTMYLHKFNVTKVSTYYHQYMTNIRSAYSQSYTMYNTFFETDSLEQQLVFTIPIFKNMPEKTEYPTMYKLPTTLKEQREMAQGNPTIEPDPEPEPIEYTGNFVEDLGLVINEGFVRGFNDETKYSEVKAMIYQSNKDADVIITTADGGELKDDDFVTTGSVIEVKDEKSSSNYIVIIKGDLNGDGKISVMDLLIVKKNILGMEKSEGNALKAGSINDSKITLKAYLAIKKHILGIEKLVQLEEENA